MGTDKFYSCITASGERCSSSSFKERKKLDCPEEFINEIKKLPLIDFKDIQDIDDGEQYEWYQVGDTKYGRFMYCTKTKTRRSQTMGEFYGNAIVD
jgi:hypothetical protein